MIKGGVARFRIRIAHLNRTIDIRISMIALITIQTDAFCALDLTGVHTVMP